MFWCDQRSELAAEYLAVGVVFCLEGKRREEKRGEGRISVGIEHELGDNGHSCSRRALERMKVGPPTHSHYLKKTL